jgi:hypothetical protein
VFCKKCASVSVSSGENLKNVFCKKWWRRRDIYSVGLNQKHHFYRLKGEEIE